MRNFVKRATEFAVGIVVIYGLIVALMFTARIVILAGHTAMSIAKWTFKQIDPHGRAVLLTECCPARELTGNNKPQSSYPLPKNFVHYREVYESPNPEVALDNCVAQAIEQELNTRIVWDKTAVDEIMATVACFRGDQTSFEGMLTQARTLYRVRAFKAVQPGYTPLCCPEHRTFPASETEIMDAYFQGWNEWYDPAKVAATLNKSHDTGFLRGYNLALYDGPLMALVEPLSASQF